MLIVEEPGHQARVDRLMCMSYLVLLFLGELKSYSSTSYMYHGSISSQAQIDRNIIMQAFGDGGDNPFASFFGGTGFGGGGGGPFGGGSSFRSKCLRIYHLVSLQRNRSLLTSRVAKACVMFHKQLFPIKEPSSSYTSLMRGNCFFEKGNDLSWLFL